MHLNTTFLKLYRTPLLMVFSCVLFYFSFAYSLVRTDYIKLIMLYSALFFMFYKLVQIFKNHILFLTWLAFIFRVIFIVSIPNLSQDFYRFIWDGRMILEGFNPYLFTVESIISKSEFPVAQAQELYAGMGELNASHFTNYPPLNQLCFVFAALFSGKSILGSVAVMRLLIIAADFGTLYFGKKLLTKLNIPVYNIFWYILNPFIIIELTGNLHFEGVMIFFLVWSLYLIHCEKWQYAAIALGLSISIKLIPLIFMPLFFQKLNWKKSLGFYLIIGLVSVILFLPFYSQTFMNNYSNSIGLWFGKFEFNASFYYVAREIGYLFRGYNEIAVIGKITPVIVLAFVLLIAFCRNNRTTTALIAGMLLVLSFYFFTAATVHPWYVATLLILSIFTNYKFPLVWSFVITLSYLAYLNTDNTENLWIIGIEYTVVYSVFFYEVFISKKAMKMIS